MYKAILSFILDLLSILPLELHYFINRGISWFMDKILRYRKRVVLTNLRHSFPDRSEKEIKDISNKFYRHLGEIFAESIWLRGQNFESLHKKGLCTITNVDEHNKDFESMTNGCMVLYSHFGNWEFLGGMAAFAPKGNLAYDERDLVVVHKKLSSPAWDEAMKKNRLAPTRWPIDGYIETNSVLRFALQHKEQRRVYMFATDQYPYAHSVKHTLDSFLGQQTDTMDGAGAIARKLGLGVVYLSIKSTKRGHYDMTFKTISLDASKMDAMDIMKKYYSLLEEDILEQPWNWLWSHKRWKNLYSYK